MKSCLRTGFMAFVSLMLILGMTWTTTSASSVQDMSRIAVMLDGKPLKNKGITGVDGTLVPLQLWIQDLGIPLQWSEPGKKASAQVGQKNMVLSMDDNAVNVTVNGHELMTRYERRQEQGQNYVALRLLTDNLGYRSTWDASNKTIHLTKIKENEIRWSNKTLSHDTKDATIQIQYPQLSGLANPKVQAQWNELFITDAEHFLQQSVEASKGAYDDIGFKYEYSSNYMIKYDANDVVSMVVVDYAYTGGAHGIPLQRAYTFHLDTGEMVTLDALLQSNPDAVHQLNAHIKASIQPKLLMDMEFKSIGENPSFYIRDEGVVIFFDAYEYTPYSEGIPEFYVPFRTLLPNLKDTLPF